MTTPYTKKVAQDFLNSLIIDETLPCNGDIVKAMNDKDKSAIRELLSIRDEKIMNKQTSATYSGNLYHLHKLNKDTKDEVCDILDFVQGSPMEKQALADYLEYSSTLKDTDEWCPLSPEYDESDKAYLELVDMNEMSIDMGVWLSEQACHELFANQHFDTRSRTAYDKLNKRSEIYLNGEVTTLGDDYATMDSQYGKVFIPKYLMEDGQYSNKMKEGDFLQVKAQFKGYPNARMSSRISMPWRALSIVTNDG